MQYFHIPQRLYIVPEGNETNIPYTRVNHNKYMVTDNVGHIGELQTSKMFHLPLYRFPNDIKKKSKQYSIFLIFYINIINSTLLYNLYPILIRHIQ